MFSDLNEKQKEAVFAGDGPLLIVAGAGSGKTKTLTARLAYLIAHKQVPPQRIIAITFTNKAADEMKSRVAALTTKHHDLKFESEPFVGTFHSFGARLLRQAMPLFGRTKSFTIFDGDDSLRTVKKAVALTASDVSKTPARFMRQISRIKSELFSREGVLGLENGEALWAIFEAYETLLERSNAFDFDDLIQKVVMMLSQDSAMRAQHQRRWDYILVDEYQDVNTAQYMLIKLLAGAHNNVNVVGDDQQSIYRFRFSDFRNFLNFEKDWPKTRTVFLEQNYRSTKNIIESSSELIARNVAQKHKNLWTENETGTPVSVLEHDDEYHEASYVVEKAIDALARAQTVGVLFRTNAQSRALEQMFIEYGVEYNLFGTVAFYERKEIKDLVAAVRLLHNPQDAVSTERLQKSLGLRRSAALVEKLNQRHVSEPAKIINFVLDATGYLERLEAEYTNAQERAENIRELMHFASQFKTAGEFLEKIALAHPLDFHRVKRRRRDHIEGANLMTIHLAKGLEFDVVCVVGVNEGTLPHQRSLYDPEDLEEERRLMYVAMTRAKRELLLNFWGTPSRFLYELPPEKIVFEGTTPLNDEERYIEYA